MFSVKKNCQLQLQVSNICHINNMFRTRSLSLMYCVKIAETSHTHQTTVNASLKVLEKCTKNLIGHSRSAFNNHESNIDC